MSLIKYPQVSIIILNWNGLKDTLECLESLKKIIYPNYEVIVVDNGSKGNDADILEEKYKDYVRVIRNKENLGFAEGNNVAIRQMLKEGKNDYVLLLNNDTVVDPDFLDTLVKVAKNDLRIGIVGPKIYYQNYPKKIWFAGGKINWWLGRTKHYGARDIEDNDFKKYQKTKEVDYITGCAILIKTKVFKKIGNLDEKFFNYFEELDFCVRAKKEDFKIFFVPPSKIWHKVSQSAGNRSHPFSLYYNTRNRLYFMRKNAKFIHWFTFLPFFAIRYFIFSSLYHLFTFQIESTTAILKGIIDFLNTRFGKVY